jgi:hypothetical protein
MVEPRASSNVVPILVAALVADVVATDPATNKKTIVGVWDALHSQVFPTARPFFLYVKLADAQGHYRVRFQFLRLEGDQAIAEAVAEFDVADRLLSADFAVPFPPLPFPEPGRYEFRIFANDVFIGSTFIDARPQLEKP